jgi:thiol-disulfide isomerase/thioredoxin
MLNIKRHVATMIFVVGTMTTDGIFVFKNQRWQWTHLSEAFGAPKKFPLNLKLPLVGSKQKKSASEILKGKKVSIVQFWASWCVGCGEVMADLAERSKKDTSVGFVTVSLDEDMPTAVRYFKAKPEAVRQALPNALLDKAGEKVAEPLSIKSLPALAILGSDGSIAQIINGHPKAEELDQAIAKAKSGT